jgi:cell division protein FtsW (lipid II flippase)
LQMSCIHALKHTISLLLFSLLTFSIIFFTIKDYPFSRKREKGESTNHLLFFILAIPYIGLTTLFQNIGYRSDESWWIMFASLILFIILLNHLSLKKLDRILRKREHYV